MLYGENSLNGEGTSLTGSSGWQPVVPGTRGEAWANWACSVRCPKKPDAAKQSSELDRLHRVFGHLLPDNVTAQAC